MIHSYLRSCAPAFLAVSLFSFVSTVNAHPLSPQKSLVDSYLNSGKITETLSTSNPIDESERGKYYQLIKKLFEPNGKGTDFSSEHMIEKYLTNGSVRLQHYDLHPYQPTVQKFNTLLNSFLATGNMTATLQNLSDDPVSEKGSTEFVSRMLQTLLESSKSITSSGYQSGNYLTIYVVKDMPWLNYAFNSLSVMHTRAHAMYAVSKNFERLFDGAYKEILQMQTDGLITLKSVNAPTLHKKILTVINAIVLICDSVSTVKDRVSGELANFGGTSLPVINSLTSAYFEYNTLLTFNDDTQVIRQNSPKLVQLMDKWGMKLPQF